MIVIVYIYITPHSTLGDCTLGELCIWRFVTSFVTYEQDSTLNRTLKDILEKTYVSEDHLSARIQVVLTNGFSNSLQNDAFDVLINVTDEWASTVGGTNYITGVVNENLMLRDAKNFAIRDLGN